MVQGTASSVGKSLLVTALCRIYARRGLRVLPFKAQNMALNSFVTTDGREVGRAQAVQAEAAGAALCVEMNPVLLKPEGDALCQVVVLGRPIGRMSALEYERYKPELRRVVADSLAALRARSDLVVIEGAGSPAEVNLKHGDIVNMAVARAVEAPVLLVGDIDRGGVFAAFVGTLELLDDDERRRIAAFVVNKFRGERSILEPGLDFLTARTGVPVLGVVPFIPHLRIADEDSAALDERWSRRTSREGEIEIAVVRLPRISNHDDVDPLAHEPGVRVRFVTDAAPLYDADLVILPGSKTTTADLAWLRAHGLDNAIAARARAGGAVLGICGGYQMLGREILDPDGVESSQTRVDGLGLLPIRTRFLPTKTTERARVRPLGPSLLAPAARAAELSAYEIHMGDVERLDVVPALFAVERLAAGTTALDGAANAAGTVVGTMLHGLFENDLVRARVLAVLRERRGLAAAELRPIASRQDEYDRLAAVVAASIDGGLLDRIIARKR